MGDPARRLATWEDLWEAEAVGRSCEVVNGELVEKASPSWEHSDGQGAVSEAIRSPFHRRGGGGRPGGWWIGTEADIEFESHEVYRPDLAGWRRDRVPAMPRGFPIRVVPDWVCEILSPTTAERDLGPKLRCYHRHHVGHYWVVDLEHRVLLVYRWGERAYQLVTTVLPAETVPVEPFEAVPIFVGRFFGDEPPDE